MQTQQVTLDRAEARALYRKYKAHQHWSKPIDCEVQRVYQLLAQGRVVIRALDSIREAWLGDDRLPKLAIVRADAEKCYLTAERDAAVFTDSRWSRRSNQHHSHRLTVPWPGFALPVDWKTYEAVTPLVPIHLRPKRGIENYAILFEAVWSKAVPVDPMLLRRVGKSDLWVVVAAWELTPVEQAVLAGRLSS